MITTAIFYIGIAPLFARYLLRLEGKPASAGDIGRLLFAVALWPLLWPVLVWLRRRR